MSERPPTRTFNQSEAAPSINQRIDLQSAAFDDRVRKQVEARRKKINSGEKLTQSEQTAEMQFKSGFPMTEAREEIEGVPVRFVGVIHDAEALLYRRKELEATIATAGTIVLETAPEASGVYESSFVEGVKKRLEEKGHSTEEVEQWIQAHLYENPSVSFFHEVEQMAKKYRKPIVTADPHSGSDRLKEYLAEEWVNRNGAKFDGAGTVAEGAILGTEILAVLTGATSTVMQSNANEKLNRDKEEGARPSRRGFLIGAASAVVATAAAPTAVANISNNRSLAPLTYNSFDARNVAIAEGVGRGMQEGKIQGPVVFIYGAQHSKPIMDYLKTPELRKLKYELYQPVRAVQPPVIEGFKFEDGSEKWGKTFSESI